MNIKILSITPLFLSSLVFAEIFLPKDDFVKTDGTKPALTEKDFPKVIKSVCNSAIKYTVDDSYEVGRSYFNGALNCAFNDLFETVVVENDKLTQKRLRLLGLDFEPEKLNFNAAQCFSKIKGLRVLPNLESTTGIVPQSFGEIQMAQTQMATFCKIEGGTSTIEENYSSCRVAEMMMNELCGYNEFLYWKQNQDKGSVSAVSLSVRDKILDGQNAVVKSELERSQKTVNEMLQRYSNFEQNYRVHSWLYSIERALQFTRAASETTRKALYTWPAKFINASSEICEQ